MEYDVFIIGGGVGGYSTALTAAKNGLKCALAEKNDIGGVCTNHGCIPTKFFFSLAKLRSKTAKLNDMGIMTGIPDLNYSNAVYAKNDVSAKLRKDIMFMITRNKVDFYSGEATVDKNRTVYINGQTVKAKNIILALGSREIDLPNFAFDSRLILTPSQVLNLQVLPKNMLIIGGGYIGMEFASIFAALGVEVTIAEQQSSILSQFDPILVKRFLSFLKQNKKIKIITGASAELLVKNENDADVMIGGETYNFDKVIVSVGRKPNMPDFIKKDGDYEFDENGNIKLDAKYMTTKKGVYAIGDFANRQQLAYTAEFEGNAVADVIAGKREKVEYPVIPYTIFTLPEIGYAGITESFARQNIQGFKVLRYNYLASGKALTDMTAGGSLKVILNSSDIVVGCEIIGEYATELIHFFTLYIKEKFDRERIINALYSHPTYSEMAKKIFDTVK